MPVRLTLALLVLLSGPVAAADAPPGDYRVAIVDTFYPPATGFASARERSLHNWLYSPIDIDADNEKEPYYHGDLVQLIAATPRASFIHYPIHDNARPMQDILTSLNKISTRMRVLPVNVLILSWESSTLISAFEQPFRVDRAPAYISTIRSWGQQHPSWQTTYRIIQALERLVLQGVSVYTIAGNGGRGMVNTFSFARGVITVGASEPELAGFVADNPFVDTYERGAYFLTRIDNSAGQPRGYDLDGDRCIDIPLHRLSAYQNPDQQLPARPWPPLKGSSFAAPMAVRKSIAAGLGPQPCAEPGQARRF